jgi:hypothetical protein
MTFESRGREDIPSLNASDSDWKKYWNSCSIGGLVGMLEKLTQMDRKKKPIENKSLYLRALECKEALSKTVREVIDRNDKLIRDIELGKN